MTNRADVSISVPLLRKEAALVLYAKGRLLRLSLLGILGVFVAVVPYWLAGCIVDAGALLGLFDNATWLFDDVMGLYDLVQLVLMLPTFVLIIAPCAVFGLRAARTIVEGRCEGHVTYGRALSTGLCLALRFLVCWLPAMITFALPFWTDDPSLGMMVLRVLASLAAAALSVPLLFLTRRFFFAAYYAAEGRSVRASFAAAGKAKRAQPRFYGSLLGSFAGLLALSVLSFGVLLFLYTLPLLTVCYCMAMRYLSESNGI